MDFAEGWNTKFNKQHSGGKPNKVLWMYMRSQQWRWECHDKGILAETGQTLAVDNEKACQYPTRFKTQNPVRVHGT